jgi:prophage antirepressor-like protein
LVNTPNTATWQLFDLAQPPRPLPRYTHCTIALLGEAALVDDQATRWLATQQRIRVLADLRQHRLVVIPNEDGNPWFVLRDVCSALGLLNPTNVYKRLHPDDLARVYLISSRSEGRLTPIISEAGLYDLIVRSDKPDARVFQRWIVIEVILSIRRTGSCQLSRNAIPEPNVGRLTELTAAPSRWSTSCPSPAA